MESQAYTINPMLKDIRALNTSENRNTLRKMGDILGSLFQYPALKECMVNTMRKGFPDVTTRAKETKGLILEVRIINIFLPTLRLRPSLF